jgi:hypothetical protein
MKIIFPEKVRETGVYCVCRKILGAGNNKEFNEIPSIPVIS